ncbi:helix-turn-helix domain-containing protein [Sporosarcina sp. FA9]|uniref:helix-turn-helix domain-containing protein n=1 Tax=Sporosarcina sp. FA9 TaxID=3413030 RepID=UPI003F657F76
MNLSSILLTIISRMDGERTIYNGLHLIRGKKSGQTLQDVEYYNLKAFFGIWPKLAIELYDEAVDQLIKSDYLSIQENSIVHVTEIGKKLSSTLPTYHFNGWDYRGNEIVFFSRLSLTIQTISNFRVGSKLFIPTERDYEVQIFVKNILYKQPINNPSFSIEVMEELQYYIESSRMVDLHKVILLHRLGGYGITGWTWNQLSESLKLNVVTIRLYFIEGLHLLLDAIEISGKAQFLRKLTDNIKVSTYLTDSATKTKRYFEKGLTMSNIAEIRRLKMSTIEDHFAEMSINDSYFPLNQFVKNEDIRAVINMAHKLKTKRLRLLKNEFNHLSYFQIRLILGAMSGGEEDGN